MRCVLSVTKAGEGTFDAVDLQLSHEVGEESAASVVPS